MKRICRRPHILYMNSPKNKTPKTWPVTSWFQIGAEQPRSCASGCRVGRPWPAQAVLDFGTSCETQNLSKFAVPSFSANLFPEPTTATSPSKKCAYPANMDVEGFLGSKRSYSTSDAPLQWGFWFGELSFHHVAPPQTFVFGFCTPENCSLCAQFSHPASWDVF